MSYVILDVGLKQNLESTFPIFCTDLFKKTFLGPKRYLKKLILKLIKFFLPTFTKILIFVTWNMAFIFYISYACRVDFGVFLVNRLRMVLYNSNDKIWSYFFLNETLHDFNSETHIHSYNFVFYNITLEFFINYNIYCLLL